VPLVDQQAAMDDKNEEEKEKKERKKERVCLQRGRLELECPRVKIGVRGGSSDRAIERSNLRSQSAASPAERRRERREKPETAEASVAA
jgi:hypothetical protein